jgi:quercetin dioxygenase-like cupin family protein
MINLKDIKSREVVPGFFGKFIHGQSSTVGVWDIKAGSSLPAHQHPHEQITYVLEGELQMKIGDEDFHFTEGMMHVIPSNTPHSARALSNCRVIDVFVPVREDYR